MSKDWANDWPAHDQYGTIELKKQGSDEIFTGDIFIDDWMWDFDRYGEEGEYPVCKFKLKDGAVLSFSEVNVWRTKGK